MTTPLRHRTHPSDYRSRGLPERRLRLRFAFARILGKANATRGHCLPGGATRPYGDASALLRRLFFLESVVRRADLPQHHFITIIYTRKSADL